MAAQFEKASVGEERVLKVFQEVDSLSLELRNAEDYYETTISEMNTRLEEKEAKAKDVKESFIEFKREIAKAAINSKNGKPITMKVNRL